MTKSELLWGIINSDNEKMRAEITREEDALSRSMRIALLDDESPMVRLTFINRSDVTAPELIYLSDDENIIVSDEAKSKLRIMQHNESDKMRCIITTIIL